MTPTVSPRLGLVVDTLDETDINTNQPNWDRVDYATGFTHTKKTTTVPVAKQFDGQLVAQTDTSITWAVTPGNTKRFMNYPYFIKMKVDSTSFNNAVQSERSWASIVEGVNHSSSDRDSATGGWKVPTKGLYAIDGYALWAAHASGIRRLGFSVNGSTQAAWEVITNAMDAGWYTQQCCKYTAWLSEGDIVRPYGYQNSGGTLTANLYMRARLIRPLI